MRSRADLGIWHSAERERQLAGCLQNSKILGLPVCRLLLTILSLEVTELDPKLDGPIELRTHFSDLCQNKNGGDGAGYQLYQFVWERDKISLRRLRLRLSGYNSIRFDTLTVFRQ